jgi:hypothetical protein
MNCGRPRGGADGDGHTLPPPVFSHVFFTTILSFCCLVQRMHTTYLSHKKGKKCIHTTYVYRNSCRSAEGEYGLAIESPPWPRSQLRGCSLPILVAGICALDIWIGSPVRAHRSAPVQRPTSPVRPLFTSVPTRVLGWEMIRSGGNRVLVRRGKANIRRWHRTASLPVWGNCRTIKS